MHISQYKSLLKLLFPFLLCSLLLTGCIGDRFQPQGWSGPALSDESLFICSKKGACIALNPSDQSTIWEFTPEAPKTSSLLGCAPSAPSLVVYSTPVISNDTVYIGDYSGKMYAIDAQSGVMKWEYATDGSIIGSPIIVGNALIVGSSDANLYSLDAQRGVLLWDEPFATDGKIWSDLVVADGTVYFGTLGHTLYAISVESGKLAWKKEFNGAITSAPMILEDTLYIGTLEGKFHALSIDSGEPRWEQPFEAENWFWTTPTFAEDTIYVGSLDHNIYAIDAGTGKLKWATPTGGEIRSAAVIVNDVLVVGSKDHKVYGLDPETGKDKWAPRDLEAEILAHPGVKGNVVYFLDQKNNLHALEINDASVIELWSKTFE